MTSRAHLKDEQGAVLVIVASAMFALVFMVALVVDVANWYEHKRHLQLQADAAALAGAHSIAIGNCSDTLIANDTRRYGGSDSPDGIAVRAQPFNNQVGGTDATHMHLLINSSAYYGEAGAGDNTDPNGAPCASKYVDVKVTETDLPWFFGGLVPKINAHARVGLFQESQSNGSLPIAVPNPLPTSAAAIFINEGNGSVIAAKTLSHLLPSGGLDMWANDANGLPDPVSVTIPSSGQASVVIALSGKQNLSLTGNLATICSQALTDCYDSGADPPTHGLSFIRGYSLGGSGQQPNQPILRSVELFNVNCTNTPYFSSKTSSCTYEVVARIDAGVGLPKANQIYTANGIQLDSSTDPNCAYVAGADQCWHANLTLPAGSSANDITMHWEETTGQVQMNKLEDCKVGNGNKCNGTWPGVAQRAYSANDNTSGPIKLVRLFRCDVDPSCAVPDFQSYPTGNSPSFRVVIGIAGTLRNATSPSDPLVTLRILSQTGQSLDCDPGYTNLKTELAKGCRPSYVPNTGTPDCSTLGTSALWATSQPWSCAAVNTGRSPNDVAAGLNERIFLTDKPANNACQNPPGLGTLGYNNWANYNPDDPTGYDGFPPGDPRVLNAFLTTYGAFSHVNGTSGSVPVIGFGHFYVTGYTGNGQGFDPPTNCNSEAVPNNDTGLIVGHFIRYIDRLGGTGTLPCDPNVINSCVIVMTK